jgi:hypothetical protein
MTREDLKDSVLFAKGNAFGKPDLKLIRVGDRTVMVKDVKEKPFLFRWTLGLWLIRKERNIYFRLRGITGIPNGGDQIDRFAFVMDFIEGRVIERNEVLSASFFSRLEEILKEVHSRGVVHLDLRHKGNILVSARGEPYLIDFNSSLSLGQKGILKKLFLPLLMQVDRAGFLKLKERVAPSLLTPEEVSSLQRLNRLRKLWIFN